MVSRASSNDSTRRTCPLAVHCTHHYASGRTGADPSLRARPQKSEQGAHGPPASEAEGARTLMSAAASLTGLCLLACAGRLQVPPGDLAQEAVGHRPIPAPRALLGVPPASGHPPCLAPVAPREGAQPGLQVQAGLLHLPRARPPWQPQEAAVQGGLPPYAHHPHS